MIYIKMKIGVMVSETCYAALEIVGSTTTTATMQISTFKNQPTHLTANISLLFTYASK